jgi:transcriptional regulator with XRE-family HTH domain
MSSTISWDSIRDLVLVDPEVKDEYDELEFEFSFAHQVIALRKTSGLTQREFAERIGIKQPQLARIERGKQIPKLETLTKIAAGAGYSLEIHFVPPKGKRHQKIQPLHI